MSKLSPLNNEFNLVISSSAVNTSKILLPWKQLLNHTLNLIQQTAIIYSLSEQKLMVELQCEIFKSPTTDDKYLRLIVDLMTFAICPVFEEDILLT